MDCVDELEASYRLVKKALFTEEQLLEKLDQYTGVSETLYFFDVIVLY